LNINVANIYQTTGYITSNAKKVTLYDVAIVMKRLRIVERQMTPSYTCLTIVTF